MCGPPAACPGVPANPSEIIMWQLTPELPGPGIFLRESGWPSGRTRERLLATTNPEEPFIWLSGGSATIAVPLPASLATEPQEPWQSESTPDRP